MCNIDKVHVKNAWFGMKAHWFCTFLNRNTLKIQLIHVKVKWRNLSKYTEKSILLLLKLLKLYSLITKIPRLVRKSTFQTRSRTFPLWLFSPSMIRQWISLYIKSAKTIQRVYQLYHLTSKFWDFLEIVQSWLNNEFSSISRTQRGPIECDSWITWFELILLFSCHSKYIAHNCRL